MSNAAKKIINSKKPKLKVIKSKSPAEPEKAFSLEDIMKMYPGLSLDSAALLSQAHAFFKKTAA